MNWMAEFLTQIGPTLLVGSTLILAFGTLMVALTRSPAQRQRIGELAVAATLIWAVVACVPLRRVGLNDWFEAVDRTSSPSHDRIQAWDFSTTFVDTALVDTATMTVEQLADNHLPGDPVSPAPWIQGSEDSARTYTPVETFDGDQDTAGDVEETVAATSGWLGLRLARVYLLGGGLCGLWLTFGRILVFRAERAAGPAPGWIRDMYEQVRRTRTARLLVSRRTSHPFSYGVFRPTIMLPFDFAAQQSTRSVLHVLRHEQAHVERRDAWGHTLVNLAFPVLYIHPLYWWLRGRIQFARELIADDWATEPDSKSSYVEDLLRMLRQRDVSFAGPIGVMGIYRFRNPLARRMRMLLERENRLSFGVSRRWLVASVTVTMMVVVGMAALFGLRAAVAGQPTDETSAAASENPPDAAERATGPSDETNRVSPNDSDADPALADGFDKPPAVFVQLEPVRDAQIPARASGVIVAIEVREGSRVKAGQLIARIDDELARLSSDIAQVAAKSMDAQAQNDVKVRVAEMASQLTRVDYTEAKDVKDRVSNAVSDYELRRREYSWKRSQLQLKQAELEHETAQDDHTKSRLELQQAKTMLARHLVVAPFDGVVEKVQKNEGEWVQAGDPICRIVQMDRLRAVGFVDRGQAGPHELYGREVSVTVRLGNNKRVPLNTRIGFVSPRIEANNMVRVWAEVENSINSKGFYLFQPGLLGEMSLGVAAASDSDRGRFNEVAKAAASRPGSGRPAKYTDEEVAYLKDLVEAHEATWKRIKALYEAGAPQGEAENEAAARYFMHVAKARVAHALGKEDECIKHCQAAVEAAEDELNATQAAHDAGALTIDRLLRAQTQRAEANLLLSRLKRGVDKLEVP